MMKKAACIPSLALALSAFASLHAVPLYFDTVNANGALNAGPGTWSLASTIWNTASNGSAAPLVGWTNGSDAIFQTGGANSLTVSENLSVAKILQTLSGTATTINATPANSILTITGNTDAIKNDSGSSLTFGSDLDIVLAPSDNTIGQEWNAANGSNIIVSSDISGIAGSAATGGLKKIGLGSLILSGNNTYSGFTNLSVGIVQAGSATAFGTSQLLFTGGTLQYGTGITTDFSSLFNSANSTAAYTIDTNGNNVSFATILGGNQGLIKRGAGTLSLSAANTFTGNIVVEGGILKANTNEVRNPFGPNTNTIEVKSGATIDVNQRGPSNSDHTYAGASAKYNLIVSGQGVADPTGTIYGGYQGAVTSSGNVSITDNPFANITMTGATTFSGATPTGGVRYGILKIDANNHDITFVNANGISWRAGSATDAANVRDIYVQQGFIYSDGSYFGDPNYTLFLNANTNPNGATVIGELRNYVNSRTISKKIQLNGGGLRFVSTLAGDIPRTWTFSGQVTLLTTPLARNIIAGEHQNRDVKISGRMTGAGGFEYVGTTATDRYSVLTLTNNSNDFSGQIRHQRGVIRMSDGASSGTLGNAANEFNFITAANTAILDLFGTNQNIGALNGASTTNHFVQNNKANTTSIITVGNGNTSGDFQGILRNYGALPTANASTADTTYTGDGATGAVLGFTKTGAGTQTLRGASTYTGDTLVEAGTLLVRNTPAAGTSATGLGNFTANGTSIVGGTGSITGADTKSITLSSGTFLMVGNTSKINAGGGGIASELLLGSATSVNLNLSGTVQVDIFANTALTPSNEADRLKLVSNGITTIGGVLEVFDTTSTSTTWALGNSWQIIDWTGVTNRNGTFAGLILPTLNASFSWDTSALYSNGVITVAEAVPEPSRALLALLAVSAVLGTRRRR